MSLPELVYVLLSVGVMLGGQTRYVAAHETPPPHDWIDQLEERLGEGVGDHDEVDVCEEQLSGILFGGSVDEVDQAAGIDDVEERVVEAEGSLVFRVTVVFLCEGEHLDLHRCTITTNRMRQLIIMIPRDIKIPYITNTQEPLFSPAIL